MSIKITSRGKGKSAVAAAAYRAGEKITNEYDGVIHDYTRKGGIAHTEILLPDHAPAEYSDRAVLWNAVEKIEKAKNAQLAREIEIALPVELSAGQNISLVRDYVKQNFVDKGMCADVCIHDKNDGNPHAHILLTMRPMEQDGTWGAKSKKEYILDDNGEKIILSSGEEKSHKVNAVDWNDQTKAEQWRGAWAALCNQYLEQADHAERIDHRSYERQGVDKIPTVHLGVAASQMEKRGILTERGDMNRAIEVTNSQLRQIRTRLRKCKDWLYSQPLTGAPSLMDMMGGVANGKNLESRWAKIADLKTQAKVLVFLQQHHITDIAQLADTVTKLYEQSYDISGKIKAAERRLDTIAEHLAQYDSYKQHRAVYEKHKQLDPKKRDAFYDKHGEEIQLYKAANQYLKAVMNGNTTLPIHAWKAEQKKLTVEKYRLFDEFYSLKDETRSVEVLRKATETIMQQEQRERQSRRAQDMEL